jgi:hypothetical protein
VRTDVSGQSTRPIFRAKAIQKEIFFFSCCTSLISNGYEYSSPNKICVNDHMKEGETKEVRGANKAE